MKHDIQIQEIEVDEQSTVWIMRCDRCGMKTRPLYSKQMAKEASEEGTCKGKVNAKEES